jgi:hypothetical protein
MAKVVATITMSLDGYITGPNDGPGLGLGEGGERFTTGSSAARGATTRNRRAKPPASTRSTSTRRWHAAVPS